MSTAICSITLMTLAAMAPSALAATPPPAKAKKKPVYDALWWGGSDKGVGKTRIMNFPEHWVKGLPIAEVDDIDFADDKEARAAIKAATVNAGDKRLSPALQKLGHVTAVTSKGPMKLRVTAFVLLQNGYGPVLEIRFKAAGKTRLKGQFVVPPRLKPYKGGPLRGTGKAKRPSRAQLKALKASLIKLHAKRTSAADDDDDDEAEGRTPDALAEKLTRKMVRLYSIKRGNAAHFLAQFKHGRFSAGAVLMDAKGRIVAPLTKRVGPSDMGPDAQDGLNISAFIDIDGDGREEILHSQWGREWDHEAMWRVDAKGKRHTHVFYENGM